MYGGGLLYDGFVIYPYLFTIGFHWLLFWCTFPHFRAHLEQPCIPQLAESTCSFLDIIGCTIFLLGAVMERGVGVGGEHTLLQKKSQVWSLTLRIQNPINSRYLLKFSKENSCTKHNTNTDLQKISTFPVEILLHEHGKKNGNVSDNIIIMSRYPIKTIFHQLKPYSSSLFHLQLVTSMIPRSHRVNLPFWPNIEAKLKFMAHMK